MGQKLICLDIGSQNLHMVYGKVNKEGILVYNAAHLPISEGVFYDGRIEEREKLKKSILKLIYDKKIKEKDLVLTIHSTSIITRDFTLPAVERKQMNNMVKYEIEQYLPIVTAEYVIEYSVVDEIKTPSEHMYKIQVAAMPKNMVENYLSLINDMGFKPIALDIHPNTVSKLFAKTKAINGKSLDMKKTFALIDLGYKSINIHILSQKKYAFSRIISLGAKELDKEISAAYHMTLEKDEIKKQEAELNPKGSYNPPIDTLHQLVQPQIDIWLSEIQKIFQYYISRTTGNRIDEIHLYGGASRLQGLSEYFEHILNIPTTNINDIDIIKPSRNLINFNPRYYINALGGLIRYD